MYIQQFLVYWLCKIEISEFWLLIITHIYIVVLFDLKSPACPRGTKAVLFCLAKFLLEALFARDDNVTLSPLLLQWKGDWGLRYRIYLFACTVLFSSWNDDDKKNFSPEL